MAVLFYTKRNKEEIDGYAARFDKNKIFRYNKESQAFMALGPNFAEIKGDANGFRATTDSGNYVFGAVGFSEPFSRMKFGRVYRGNSMVHTTLPSTINTPIPMFTYDYPFNTLKQLILDPLYKNLLAFLGV